MQILDDLRLLFNFKMDSEPILLILAGQPQIRNKLALNTISSNAKDIYEIFYARVNSRRNSRLLTSRLKIAG